CAEAATSAAEAVNVTCDIAHHIRRCLQGTEASFGGIRRCPQELKGPSAMFHARGRASLLTNKVVEIHKNWGEAMIFQVALASAFRAAAVALLLLAISPTALFAESAGSTQSSNR